MTAQDERFFVLDLQSGIDTGDEALGPCFFITGGPIDLSGEKQAGKATTTSWSPILKKLVALASVETEYAKPGTSLQMEITIEAMRLKTNVKVTNLPFFSPPRKTATPV